jgi:hypothetical protein
MVAAGGGEEERFADRIPTLVVSLQQQAANRFGARGPARFARAQGGDPGTLEPIEQQLRLGRFPGPLPALDRDQPAALRRMAGRGGQRRSPQIK